MAGGKAMRLIRPQDALLIDCNPQTCGNCQHDSGLDSFSGGSPCNLFGKKRTEIVRDQYVRLPECAAADAGRAPRPEGKP